MEGEPIPINDKAAADLEKSTIGEVLSREKKSSIMLGLRTLVRQYVANDKLYLARECLDHLREYADGHPTRLRRVGQFVGYYDSICERNDALPLLPYEE